MKRFLLVLITLVAVMPAQNNLKAQSTYAQVFSLIQTHCAGTACHDGTVPRFNINVSADSFYNEVVGLVPQDSAAAANFNKVIAPGDVQHSYLLRKIGHGISDGIALNQPAEGDYMPYGQLALANNEIELVRQWIMYGAPKDSVVVDTGMINTFYRKGGIDDTYSPHATPAAGTGFQIYYGRFFLNAGTSDTEVFYKVDPHLVQAVESPKVDFMMPADDHHFVLYLFQPGGDVSYPWGIRPLSNGSMEFDQYGIGAGPGLNAFNLPANTAFYFEQNQMFDLDLHIQNPSIDSIYSCDIYINIFTEPSTTTSVYMKTESFINQGIAIPEDNQFHSFPLAAQDSSRTNNWNIWKLYSHTHKYGTAFNMWLNNPDGSQGPEVYNGNYSYEDGYNVGYYRWGPHATVRTWPDDSLFAVNPYSGISGSATWMNTAGPDTVWWGFSSADEMQVIFIMYVDGEPINSTAVSVPASNNISAEVFPNPASDNFIVKYSNGQNSTVVVDLLDMLGNKVTNLINEQPMAGGEYTHSFSPSDYKLAAGIYIVSFDIGGKVETRKLVITE